ncbi:MAG: LysM peptidoglycan-binding domain-containing protein [Eubacterium sp.]|nr:LysM peptidoglycan-binding domain-containing protein [Eubacterium sp.]
MFMKYRIKHKIRFTVFSVVLILLFITAFNTVTGDIDANGSSSVTYKTVTVHSGDTLWSIAKANMNESEDIRKYIYEISKYNNVSANSLVAGQTLLIPA